MNIIVINYNDLLPFEQDAVREGYAWGCSCGESYRTREAAESCRKCREYLSYMPTSMYFTEERKV